MSKKYLGFLFLFISKNLRKMKWLIYLPTAPNGLTVMNCCLGTPVSKNIRRIIDFHTFVLTPSISQELDNNTGYIYLRPS